MSPNCESLNWLNNGIYIVCIFVIGKAVGEWEVSNVSSAGEGLQGWKLFITHKTDIQI